MGWKNPRKILCIRPDNMGDLLMSSPAIRALKETLKCSITLLTSSMAMGIASYIPAVDNCIVWDVPWVKGTEPLDAKALWDICQELKQRKFDAAVIFTVFSQNPMPTAMLAAAADIPYRLAYCRENPYHLLTHWIPDEEPYQYIRHQVRRDLDLVKTIGAHTSDESIAISFRLRRNEVMNKLSAAGVNLERPWIVLHPGASEPKREYPATLWIEAARKVILGLKHQIILTGVDKERSVAAAICEEVGREAYNLTGAFSLEELITLIQMAPLLISVNTATVHIASAVKTPVIVLYALTNPQHAPWKATGMILPFSVPEKMQSRNAVLRYVHDTYYSKRSFSVSPDDIFMSCERLLIQKNGPSIEDLVLPGNVYTQGKRKVLNFKEP
jgi:lipopolysaccharide heptosyltransferase II